MYIHTQFFKAHSEKMQLEMVIGMEIGILNGQSPGHLSMDPFEKKAGTLLDSDLHVYGQFESRRFHHGLHGPFPER